MIFVTQTNIQSITHLTISSIYTLNMIRVILALLLAMLSNKLFEQGVKIKSNKGALIAAVIVPIAMLIALQVLL